jgi:hypothetical protein
MVLSAKNRKFAGSFSKKPRLAGIRVPNIVMITATYGFFVKMGNREFRFIIRVIRARVLQV